MRLECPNGHAGVVRHDPKGTGMIGMCDLCGWSAAYVVSRESESYEANGDHDARRELTQAQREEQERRQLTAGAAGAGDPQRRARDR